MPDQSARLTPGAVKRGQLRDCFRGVGANRLSAVDADPGRWNQYEVGTTRKMREQFPGEGRRRHIKAVLVWLGDDRYPLSSGGTATHYDAREN
ncbi:MAG: hypothetical protein OXN89_07190 [Bryobacterales bacterium]|nr:hypothetical protein [Bryobacterales bacterium]